jgi:hypothetical protein
MADRRDVANANAMQAEASKVFMSRLLFQTPPARFCRRETPELLE